MKKILLIDEEKWFIEAIFDRINKEYGEDHYDYAFNGSEGLDLLNQNDYSLVILDLMLPLGPNIQLPEDEPDLMYGICILRQIRINHKFIPIICYTILNENSIKVEISKNNAIHICKLDNNSFDELFREIKNQLKLR